MGRDDSPAVGISVGSPGIGRIMPTPGYAGARGGWGPNPVVDNRVDGPRNAPARVYTSKCGGQAEACRDSRINLLNTLPAIDDWSVRIERAPEVTPQGIIG